MKLQLLPGTIDEDGRSSQRQHLACFVFDDVVAIDAGSLAFSCSNVQRRQIRDILITHNHLDHIAGLPLFIDDLFSTLREPVRVHATPEMIEILERDIFNWSTYPRFTETENNYGPVMTYCPFDPDREFAIKHLRIMPVSVNHRVPSVGVRVGDGRVSIGLTGDTAETDAIWTEFARTRNLAAVIVECAFPDELGKLADVSHHLTPSLLARELSKLGRTDVPVLVANIKPAYREQVVDQIRSLGLPNVDILTIGKVYEF